MEAAAIFQRPSEWSDTASAREFQSINNFKVRSDASGAYAYRFGDRKRSSGRLEVHCVQYLLVKPRALGFQVVLTLCNLLPE
jgi:hypothetical protein